MVGTNTNGTIQNCYSIGSVTGGSNLGGLVGVYNSGGVTNSFWDTETSGRATSGAGTGKTSEEMKTASTFTGAGWDFYGESVNGTDEIWNINETRNNNYPFLTWQYPDESPLPVELTSFAASVNENKVVLNWQTATEVNNYGFEIQKQEVRSKKPEEAGWEKVGFVEGHGNSNSPKEYSFIDQEYDQDQEIIRYRLKQIDFDGKFEYSEIITVEMLHATSLPTEFSLEQNYPNPFNPSTSIEYSVVSSEYVNLKVYDVLGNEVATLVNEKKDAGKYEVKFDASKLTSGMYIYRIQAGDFVQTRKMLLLR